MFNPKKNKTIYKVETGSGASGGYGALGILLVVVSVIMLLGICYVFLVEDDFDEVFAILPFLALAVLANGFGYLMTGNYISQAYVLIYENGVAGNAVKINGFLPFLTKQLPFDMSFQEVTATRYEGGLLIYQNTLSYPIPIKREEAVKIMNLILEYQSEGVNNNRKVINTVQTQEREMQGTMVCRSCGAKIIRNVKFCTACGRKVEEPLKEVATSNSSFCPNCGAHLNVGQTFCSNCGIAVKR